ncbi:MAG: endonuclease/exonuclease/phosphatase family protein [Bacteroidaceae bacterium]|nr:endonuclease/exonuclease/phosphatase family protein [Bacteroidaceae bacterium]
MKKFLLSAIALVLALNVQHGKAQGVDLSSYSHVTDLSQVEEGAYYYIVSDRTKFNYEAGGDGGTDGNKVQTKAMSNYQSGYTATNWDNPSRNVFFVYYGDLDVKCNGFIWKAEKVGDSQWGFLNMENGKYMGHNNPGETDLRFADDVVGFTLTDLSEGQGRWAFTNADYSTPLNVHQYKLRKSRGVLALNDWSDAKATDAETYGYPGRWHLYKTTLQDDNPVVPDGPTIADKMEKLRINRATDMVEGEEYFIVSDRTAYVGNSNDLPKAMASQQDNFTTKWGPNYVYWADIDTTCAGFVWIVKEMPGDQWAFQNKENGRYLGNMNSGETDVVFSDTPVGYTLADLSEGAGRFTFINSESEFSLHVQGYLRDRANNSLAKQENGNDDYTNDVSTNGYPGRWQIFLKNTKQIKNASELTEDATYYIVSDRKAYASSTSKGLRAMSSLQESYTVNWGSDYVYWGEMDAKEDGFKWTAKKEGDKWAFKNKDTERYLGNMKSGESDVIFSDTPVGYALADLEEGAGRFTLISDEDTHSLHVQGYLRGGRPNNSLAKNEVGDDDHPGDVETNGYPGRWKFYEVTATASTGGDDYVYDKYVFDTITVVSYNICHCEGTDGRLDLKRTANVIMSYNPTVVAMQEVDRFYSSRSNNEDQVQRLAEETGMYGRFGTMSINCGNGVLSKDKPLLSRVVDIGDGRNMLVVELKNFVFGSLHVGLSIAARQSALKAIREEAARWEEKGKPFIVAGDFNDDGTEGEMQGVWGLLCDSLAKDFTFHSDRKTPTWGAGTYVIDHIISYNKIGGVKGLTYEVGSSNASDHLPIAATLRIGFPREMTPEQVHTLIQDSVAAGSSVIDLTGMAFDPTVTADDLRAESNALVYVDKESGLTGTNIVVNNACQNIELTDGSSFTPVNTITAKGATYRRIADGEWGTICLPFAAKSTDAVEFYTISRVDDDALILEKLATLTAGTPALVRNVSGEDIAVTMGTVRVMTSPTDKASGNAVMHGTFTTLEGVSDANAYTFDGDRFVRSTEPFTCDPFRAYLTMEGLDASALAEAYVISDDATAIRGIENGEKRADNNGQIYDLSGRKVKSQLNRGIYINGQKRKVLIK